MTWRSIFFVNLLIGLPAILIAFLVIAASPSKGARQRVDMAGAVLGTGATVLLVLALAQAATLAVGLGTVLLYGLLSLLLLVGFVFNWVSPVGR